MAVFSYTGYDAQGKKTSGNTEASNEKAAVQALRAQGVFPTSLKARSTGPSRALPTLSLGLRRGLPLAELAASTRQLATLLAAGLSLDEALELLVDQIHHPVLSPALRQIRQEVIEGRSLSEAMGQHANVFPSLLVSMVDVGEQSGRLAGTLMELADYLDNQARIRSRVQSSLAYPVLMALVGTGVLAFLFVYVMPKIIRIVEGLETELPLPTKILLGISHAVSAYWWLGLLLIGGAFFGLWRYYQTPKGRLAIDRRLLNLPLFGSLMTQQLSARFSRTLATLLQAGVPLLKALGTCRTLASNSVFRQTIDRTIHAVREGDNLTPPLRQSGLFPPMMMQMMAIGEQSGELESMLLKVADAYEHQFDLRVNRFLSLLEPLMILFMGCVVGFVVLSILLPIFEASQGLG